MTLSRREQQLHAEALLRFRAGAIDAATLERIPERELRAELERATCPARIEALGLVLATHDQLRAEAVRLDLELWLRIEGWSDARG